MSIVPSFSIYLVTTMYAGHNIVNKIDLSPPNIPAFMKFTLYLIPLNVSRID